MKFKYMLILSFAVIIFGMYSSRILADNNKAPEFTGITDWIHTKPLQMKELQGKVVIVHFWTFGCINCIHNYPYYRKWSERVSEEKNLVQIGVHRPEFDFEKNKEEITAQMKKHRLSFPTAIDNDAQTWRAWKNRYWPCIYLVDKKGVVRHRWEGEMGDAGFKSMSEALDRLLKE